MSHPAAPAGSEGATPPLTRDRIPRPIQELLGTLLGDGQDAALVGGCVRDLLRGARVRDFDVTSSAPPERVLEIFPHAVPVGLRHGTVMVPTEAGPVDVTTWRGASLEEDLGRRDLTVNAMAWDGNAGALVDPFAGRRDLAGGRLRAVGDAAARMAEDPLRALRAARLAAQLGFDVDSEVCDAMRDSAPALDGVARERLGAEIDALLVAPHPGRGIRLLQAAGIADRLAAGTLPDAADVLDRLPADRVLRWAAWMRGASPESVLMRLRRPRVLATRLVRLLALHPIEEAARPERGVDVRRLLRRAGDDFDRLVQLRRAELIGCESGGEDATARLAALERAVAHARSEGSLALRRHDLALDGRDVMEHLGCRPGRAVGRALDFLTERVLQEPACNTRDRLLVLLDAWWAETRR